MSSAGHSTTVVLVCHAPLATALHAVACHAFGQGLADLQTLDVMAGATPDAVADDIDRLLVGCGSPTPLLFLTDVQGATPANGIARWCARQQSQAGIPPGDHPPMLAGVSLPLLLRALTHRHQPAESLAQELLGCTRALPCRMENPGPP